MPPLLNVTIKRDMNLTDGEIANSNIIAGVASLLVRLVAGPLCDRFGPVSFLRLLRSSRSRLTRSILPLSVTFSLELSGSLLSLAVSLVLR